MTTHDDLQVAVSTNGRSPAVAAWLRRTIDGAIGPEHATVLTLASEVRTELRSAAGTSESAGWEAFALDDHLLDLVRAGDLDAARRSASAPPSACDDPLIPTGPCCDRPPGRSRPRRSRPAHLEGPEAAGSRRRGRPRPAGGPTDP